VTPAGGTVVDSSVLLDVFTQDKTWGNWSEANLLAVALRGALVINAVVLALLTRDPKRVAAYIPGTKLIAP